MKQGHSGDNGDNGQAEGGSDMRPLWTIGGWSRDGVIADALRKAFRVSSEEPVSNAAEALLQAFRNAGRRRKD